MAVCWIIDLVLARSGPPHAGLPPVDEHAASEVETHGTRNASFSKSRPFRIISSSESRWLTLTTSCSMIGPTTCMWRAGSTRSMPSVTRSSGNHLMESRIFCRVTPLRGLTALRTPLSVPIRRIRWSGTERR